MCQAKRISSACKEALQIESKDEQEIKCPKLEYAAEVAPARKKTTLGKKKNSEVGGGASNREGQQGRFANFSNGRKNDFAAKHQPDRPTLAICECKKVMGRAANAAYQLASMIPGARVGLMVAGNTGRPGGACGNKWNRANPWWSQHAGEIYCISMDDGRSIERKGKHGCPLRAQFHRATYVARSQIHNLKGCLGDPTCSIPTEKLSPDFRSRR